MITNTNQGQKSLALLLDEIERKTNVKLQVNPPGRICSCTDCKSNREKVALVKALRRAMLSLEVTHCDAALAEMAAILEEKEA